MIPAKDRYEWCDGVVYQRVVYCFLWSSFLNLVCREYVKGNDGQNCSWEFLSVSLGLKTFPSFGLCLAKQKKITMTAPRSIKNLVAHGAPLLLQHSSIALAPAAIRPRTFP